MELGTVLKHLNDPALDSCLTIFLKDLISRTDGNLKSVMLFGGVARNDYNKGRSNVNVFMVFDHVDLEVLNQLVTPTQSAMGTCKLSPFILTTGEVGPASSVFAVKLFDIQAHHILLYGEDLVKALQFSDKHLAFISEQELRNQLTRMKFYYLQHFNVPERLTPRILNGFTTLLVNANIYFHLKYGTYLSHRFSIAERLGSEPGFSKALMQDLGRLRKGEINPEVQELNRYYDELMIQYKYLIKLLKQLSP
jgi:hypothetical protein